MGAIQDYNKAIKLNPKDSGAYFSMGISKDHLKNYREAIQDYTKVIELNPNHANAYNNRGLAKIFLEQKDDGCLDLSKAGELGHAKAYEAIKEYCN
jgi:tetratricopeptide (TPR) repeat protein